MAGGDLREALERLREALDGDDDVLADLPAADRGDRAGEAVAPQPQRLAVGAAQVDASGAERRRELDVCALRRASSCVPSTSASSANWPPASAPG